MHGKDITVPKGAEITAYINGDMKLGLTRFQPTPQASAAPAMSSQPSGSQSGAGNSGGNSTSFPTAKLSVTSIPDGADIEIDGSFVGNTPSDVEVSPGDHTISVKKPGFKEWERKLKVSSGSSVHLNAELEKVAVQ
jgi:hypothetical protein